MSYFKRLHKALKGANTLPLTPSSKYVLFSDCHRGDGSSNDNFLKNQPLFLAALRHYYNTSFTYIELGDGDELWENKSMKPILEIHNDIFRLLSLFQSGNRLYMLYGNHDMMKKNKRYSLKHYSKYPYACCNNPTLTGQPLMPEINFYEGLLLKTPTDTCSFNRSLPTKDIFLTHGHQTDLFNSVLWRLSRFLVRHLWKPLEHLGISDPTNAAKNYSRMKRTEKRLQSFAQKYNLFLIAGHTHRPYLSKEVSHYANTGSCVHPYSITCLEIEKLQISLVKWSISSDSNNRLFVKRELLEGPHPLP